MCIIKKFEQEFYNWLAEASKEAIPPEVNGYYFGLFEFPFGIELIGSDMYDSKNSDWPCTEIWEPKVRKLDIPVSYSTESWEECLNRMKKLLVATLNSSNPMVPILKQSCAIAIGFVDGGLEDVWPETNTYMEN